MGLRTDLLSEKRNASRKEKSETGVLGFGCSAKESLASEEGCCSERVASLKGWGLHKIQG